MTGVPPARATRASSGPAMSATMAGVSARTARKWIKRYREEGDAGLLDRSSAPRRVHNATAPDRVEAIAALRR